MSRENVEVVRQLLPPADVDLADVFMRGDDLGAAAALDATAQQFTDDFVCVIHIHGLSSEERPGVQGLREAWLDWLEPWETYRVEIEQLREVGDRVLVTTRDFGRRSGMADEVELKGSAVWTIRDGKVARAEFFAERGKALEAVGLRE
jgi:ketosteroid isomerase-like protein